MLKLLFTRWDERITWCLVNTSESHPHPDLNPQGLQCQGIQGLLDCAHLGPKTPLPQPPPQCLSVKCGPISSTGTTRELGRASPPHVPPAHQKHRDGPRPRKHWGPLGLESHPSSELRSLLLSGKITFSYAFDGINISYQRVTIIVRSYSNLHFGRRTKQKAYGTFGR